MNELYFQEMSISKPPRPRGEREELFTSPSPVVALSPRVALPFGKSPIGKRLEQELGILRHRIQTVMPIVGGVLLRISIHESKEPDEEGHARQRFVDLEILRGGPVPSLVAFTALPQARRIRRAPPGWVGKALYVWVTR
jgi:hypothetical protein